jgi:murein L,D-transpeptidase YafK
VQQVVVRWSALIVLAMVGFGGRASATEFVAAGVVPGRPVIEIWKSERRLELRYGDQVDRQFKVVLGRAPRFAKEERGDYRTPVGRYYISGKHVSRFHRFLGISYPNIEDAERGYQRGLISADQWADIFFANLSGDMPPPRTQLGGMVGIHGFGSRRYVPIDWTEGCIAVSNEEIEYLYDVTPVGTPVIINE